MAQSPYSIGAKAKAPQAIVRSREAGFSTTHRRLFTASTGPSQSRLVGIVANWRLEE